MPYDKKPTRYQFPSTSVASAGAIFDILGPKGKKGHLHDYGVVNPTVAFTATTLPSYVSVGTVADADAYGDELSMGTIGVDSGGKSLRSTYATKDAGFAASMINRTLPADTVVSLHITAPTGGTPAGTAQPFVEISWED